MNADEKKHLYALTLVELKSLLAGWTTRSPRWRLPPPSFSERFPLRAGPASIAWSRRGLLRVGPYQGGIGCLEIPFDRGVCGAAAREERPSSSKTSSAFPGHIACDAAARSEIVVPIHVEPGGKLCRGAGRRFARPAAFERSSQYLEKVAAELRPCLKATPRLNP